MANTTYFKRPVSWIYRLLESFMVTVSQSWCWGSLVKLDIRGNVYFPNCVEWDSVFHYSNNKKIAGAQPMPIMLSSLWLAMPVLVLRSYIVTPTFIIRVYCHVLVTRMSEFQWLVATILCKDLRMLIMVFQNVMPCTLIDRYILQEPAVFIASIFRVED
jgi:hypothetical protein